MSNNSTVFGKIGVIFAALLLFAASSAAQISLRTALDTDKDGKADFTVFRPENGYWYTLKSGGGGYTYQQFGVANTDFTTPGDYDGDGKGDISVWRDTNGMWYRLNSSDGTFVAYQFGLSGDEPVARDYDGDGKTDIAVVRRTGGNMTWYVLGSQRGFYGFQFGYSTDFTAPGDYDGDGKFDLAVQRPGATPTSQAIFYVLNSRSGNISGIYYGYSSDIFVPGDYDGDGKTDFAVVREGARPTDNLVWYIFQSSTNTLLARTFGLTESDLTVQNDYDGDGKTDIAVWRNTNGTFYYLRSSEDFLTYAGVQWGSPSDVPVAGHDTH